MGIKEFFDAHIIAIFITYLVVCALIGYFGYGIYYYKKKQHKQMMQELKVGDNDADIVYSEPVGDKKVLGKVNTNSF